MAKNALPAVSAALQPRGLIQVNGVTVVGWLSWEVENNSFYAADTFRALFSIGALPDNRQPDWWLDQTEMDVEVFAGFPRDPDDYDAAELESLIVGRVDEVTLELSEGKIEVTGRDLTSKLIDTKTSEKYINQTASQVATTLAAKYGLTPIVTDTETNVGRYYNQDHVRLQDERTEWDLLSWLAREEGFIVYVRGRELHFEPAPSPDQEPYVLEHVAATDDAPAYENATRIRVARALTLARGIKVTVRSWNRKQSKGFVKTAETKKPKSNTTRRSPIPAGTTQEYFYTIPNLTPDQAQARANQILTEISRHEYRLEVDGPADNILQRTDVIELKGSGSTADQVYFPDTITRSMSMFDDGYRWRIVAKNHTPESQPPL